MSFQTVVEEVKGRVETLGAQGQQAAKISFDTLKQANTIVVESFQELVSTHTTTAKDLFASAKSGFEKAKADGFMAVASDPIAYLPASDKLVTAINETIAHVGKTGEEIFKTVKTGFEHVQSQFTGEPVVVVKAKSAAKSAIKTVKKTATTVKKEAAKAAR